MIPALALGFGWLKNNWKLLAILAAVIFLIIAAWTVLGWYHAAQRLEQAQDTVGESVPVEEEQRSQLVSTVTDAGAIQQQLEQERLAAADRERLLQEALRRRDAQIDRLLARQSQERARVDALREEELQPEIVMRLGLRRPEDSNPNFYAHELKALAQCVNQYPLCQERLAERDSQVQELRQQMHEVKTQVSAIAGKLEQEERKTQAYQTYSLQLLGHYREAVNAIGLKKRSGKCLFLWKCGERKLPVPRPEELQAEAPKD